MAKKDPRANSLIVLRGNSIQLEGRYDVLKDRPELVSDGSGSYIVMDNQEGVYVQMVAPPNGDSQILSSNLAPVPFTLGPHGATAPWGSPFLAWDPNTPVLFGEAADKDTPLRSSGAPVRISNDGKYANNALPYRRPIYFQKLLELKRSSQIAVDLTTFSGSGTVAMNEAWTNYNPNYLRPFQSDQLPTFQSGNLYIQGPVQPVWWSVANWKLNTPTNADYSRMGRSLIQGTVGPNAVTSSLVPSPYIYASGTTVPAAGTQPVRFATGGAIRDLSAVSTYNKHFRPDATMTRQDVLSGSVTASLGEYVEDSGRLIQSPLFRIVPVDNLSAVFDSVISADVTNATVVRQFFDKSSFHNFLLMSGTQRGIPETYRASLRFNSIAAGAQFDYGMRRMASTNERFGFQNQLEYNKYVRTYGDWVLSGEGMQQDLVPFPSIALHNYYSPVHMFTMGGGEYKNRREVSMCNVFRDTGSGNSGFAEVGRQFSSHIDVVPTFEETPWQTPGFFGFGWTKFPDTKQPNYSGSKRHNNGENAEIVDEPQQAPAAILTPEDYRFDPSLSAVIPPPSSSMKINYGLYHKGLTSASFLYPPTADVETNDAYFWPDSFADARLVMRDKPEDHDISPLIKFVRAGSVRNYISKSIESIFQIINPLGTGSPNRLGRPVSQWTGYKMNNLQRFYFIDTEYGRDFALRMSGTAIEDPGAAAGLSPKVSISRGTSSIGDFSTESGIGGHWYSKPQADSFPFHPSNFDASYGAIDSGDPWPWNVHGSNIPFQTFVRRNHLYSINNSTSSLAGLGGLEFASGGHPHRASFLTMSDVPRNDNLAIERNSVTTGHPILAGAAAAPAAGPSFWRLNVGRSFGMGFRGGRKENPIAPQTHYFTLGFPARGFEYFLTSAYYPNNISDQPVQSPMMMSTAGFDIPFSGSQDIAIDVWVQFMSASTNEVTQT